MPTYREFQKAKFQKKIDAIVNELPESVYLYVIGTESSVSPYTLYEYLYCIYRFYSYIHEENPELKKKSLKNISYEDLDKLTADDIDEFLHKIFRDNLNDLKPERAARTRNHYLTSLRSYFAFLFSRDKLQKNIVDKVNRSRIPKRQFVVKLNPEEEERMINTVESGNGLTERMLVLRDKNDLMAIRDQTIVRILLKTGIRVSELVGLNEKDIHFEQHCFTVQRKREKPDVVYMDDNTETLLKSYLEFKNSLSFKKDKDAVFIVTIGKFKGERISVRSVQLLVKKYAIAGVPEAGSVITPHRLRATYATDLLRASGGNIKLVQEAMAHESIQTTLVYTGNDTSDKYKNRNLLKENES